MFDDRTPIYRQIAGQLREDIVSGLLDDDEQVMSTNQYAAFYRINPATAAKGFAQLVDEGVLYKKRGIGMFVSPPSGPKMSVLAGGSVVNTAFSLARKSDSAHGGRPTGVRTGTMTAGSTTSTRRFHSGSAATT